MSKEKYTCKFLPVIIDSLKKEIESIKGKKEVRRVTKRFTVDIQNCHDITFKFLDVVQYSKNYKVPFETGGNYQVRLAMFQCCLMNSDCECDDDDDDECSCGNRCPPNHHVATQHDDTLESCYEKIMDSVHFIFKCRKCRTVSESQYQCERDELICNSCLLYEDLYARQSEVTKKRKLFDCYVCREEKMNKRYKAELNCSGASKHTDELCKWCFSSNNNKCPQCR
jgi:hypothetical protein